MRSFSFAFIRHGATDLNLRDLRCGGDLDVPLTEAGYDMVFDMACWMWRREIQFGTILCGTLLRTRQTALILSGVLGALPIVTLPELNERHLGDWNGRPISETEDLLSNNVAPPGGESENEFIKRVHLVLSQIYHYRDERPLVVSSKGVGRALYTLMGGKGRLSVENCELLEFTRVTDNDGVASLELGRRIAVKRS